jgi:hypothetical protein
MVFLSLRSSEFLITSIQSSDRIIRHCSRAVAMVVVTGFFESLWSTSMRLSLPKLSLSSCGMYELVIFHKVDCESLLTL